MVPNGWEKGVFESGIQLISGQHVDAKDVNNTGEGLPYLTGPADFINGNIRVTKFTSNGKKQCKKGDLLITVKGSGTGKVIESDDDYVISRQLMAVRAIQFDPKFIYYNLISSVNRYEGAAAGLIPGISRDDVLHTPLLIPPLIEQRKIANILGTWDKAISTTERLIDNSKQQKKALMQQLLTGAHKGKRLLDDSGKPFEGEWKRVELGKLLDYKQPTPYLVKSTEYSNEYPTPVLTAGKTFILGYSNEDFGIFKEELPAIIFDDFTTASKFVDFPFKAKSSAMKILVAKDGVSIKYIYEAMQVLNYPIGGHQRHWISIFANLVIGLPSPEEQQKIAAVLTNADKEVELLEQQLADLKQEKKALMQQLLTGKRKVIV